MPCKRWNSKASGPQPFGLRYRARLDGMRVVRGKLWIDPVGHAQQFARVADVADVGVMLGGEDRKPVDPFDLGAFDLGVPIGAFDKADHDLAIQPRCQIV